MRRLLSKRDAEVLLAIACQGRLGRYRLASELGISYSTCDVSVKRLSKRGLLRASGRKRWRTGLPMRTYELTVKGLCAVLDREKARESIDEIITSNRALLPLVFGKWNFFRENDLERVAMTRLIRAVHEAMSEKLLAIKRGREIPLTYTPEYVTEQFYRLDGIVGPEKDFPRWVEAMSEDPELREYALRLLDKYEERARDTLTGVSQVRKLLLGRSSKKTPSKGKR